MAHYLTIGDVPHKRHTQHRRADGGLYYEELMGEEGFSSDSSLLYHRELPSAIVDARPWDQPELKTHANYPLKPRHLKLHELFPGDAWRGVDVVRGRRLVLGNGDVRISYAVSDTPSPFYRNGIGDECVYVESGSATVETVFGTLEVGTGDYVILPRATTHRWVPRDVESAGPLRAYCIEGNSHIAPPKRYLSRYGQLLEHAPYCERDLRIPVGPLLASESEAARGHRRLHQAPRRRAGRPGRHGLHLPVPPARRRGLGRLPVSLRLQRFRLRADHRPDPPAPAGPPGLRGLQLRGLQLRPAQGRLPPAVDPGALLPLERRQRRGHVLLRRRLRGAQGFGHRAGLDLAASGRSCPRPAAGRLRAQHRRGVLRRAGRHGRHLPAAGDR